MTMRQLLHSEVIKLRTTRTFAGLLIALATLLVVTIVVPVVVAPLQAGRFALAGDFAQRTMASAGATTAGVVAIILGVLAVAGEYRHGTLTSSLLIAPRRGILIAAKGIVHLAAGSLLGAAASLFAAFAMVLGVHLRGGAVIVSGRELAAIVVGGTVYVGLAALLGLGLGAALRDPVVALAGIFTLFYVVENVLVGAAPDLARWLPGQAGSALAFPAGPQTSSGLVGAHVLSQLTGGMLFATYTGAAMLVSWLTTSRRDIT